MTDLKADSDNNPATGPGGSKIPDIGVDSNRAEKQSNGETGLTTTRYVLDAIARQGVHHVFMVPGGVVDPFLDQFGEAEDDVKAIVAANEAGAAYMADGYARASGLFGVCLGIGGPGIANMVGPLAAAYSDGSPVLTLAGEIPTDWDGRGGFQDASTGGVNDIGFLSAVTAMSREIPEAKMVPRVLDHAMRTMLGREQKPVSLSFPKQIQTQVIPGEYSGFKPLQADNISPRGLDLHGAKQLLAALEHNGAGNIAILAGSGAIRSQASDKLLEFAQKYYIPVATTLKAKGVFPETHPLSLGVFGYAGTNHATLALLNGDKGNANCPNAGIDDNRLLLVLGSSLNQRDTMRWDQHLKPEAGIYQVDVDIANFSKNFPVDTGINGDICTLLEWLLQQEQGGQLASLLEGAQQRRQWLAAISEKPRYYQNEDRQSTATPMHPARIITELQIIAPKNTVIIADSGAHRAFAGHYWQSHGPRQYLTAAAMAPMGWAIPAGIGAKVACPDKPCVVITGDGCMLMNGIEIQSAAKNNLPLIVLVINNSALGNVYLRAKTPIAKQLTSLATHDWVAFSRSLGGDGIRVENPRDLSLAFDRAFAANGPFVIDARCSPDFETPINPWRKAVEQASWSED
ncbi:thiamine pyrophosphate-binding protein [Thalassomonas haliotis]|uniref:Thiamine pyrophosphate-binding protein n=1 Tax=Thalassomonas haliotis TaxID=485448 RepID=A0ABY7V8I4_9GAMM|nr:thiamine pyrophosphate-binding protein [Thalassomonas haliotis]WDE09950.1 thiamine pyrophosphate-binding protein [Thalassomonas haliotis]